jgi:pyruvate dehydrogenase E2 component (dihydrolipoamide acetyltransferase)
MAEYIVMPKLGFDMREGVLVNWFKGVGDLVAKGDVVAEIESDKATLELDTVLKLLADEGDVVPIGGNLAIVGDSNEEITLMAENGSGAPSPDKQKHEEHPQPTTPSVESTDNQNSTSSGAWPGGYKATPVARRLAGEAGIDLGQVAGTGPGGRIRKADVEKFAESATKAPATTFSPTPVPTSMESVEVATTKLRQAIGRRMVESKTTIPHFYVTTEVDMAPALALRKELNALLSAEQKITVNDMIVKAAAQALRSYPNLNASYAGDKVVRHGHINVGTAVAIEGGLLTVVQQNTDFSPLAQIATDNRTMITRARDGKSRPGDFEGGTFTVSNLGAFEVDHFIAIINPPDACIMAVGTAKQVPVVVDGELTVGWRMKATISADHRVTDGAEAAQYMQHFKAIMEEPLRLLL